MATRIPDEALRRTFARALARGLVGDADTAVIFHDLSRLRDRLRELVGLFPTGTLHAIAIKANPLTALLRAVAREGVGLEAASLPEVYLAEAAGLPPQRIVYDAPSKTKAELAYALERGVAVNADSFAELERIDRLWGRLPSRAARIGVRVNPQVGRGRIAITSVADTYSKFGIPIESERDRLIEAFARYPWLCGLHVHTGSQGCGLDLLVRGVRVVLDLAGEINRIAGDRGTRDPGTSHRGAGERDAEGRGSRVRAFDIGGGLPVAYRPDETAPTLAEYAAALRAQCPELFDGTLPLITEFGRAIHAPLGWVATRVEYVKEGPPLKTALVHVGADLLLRRCYHPADWVHRISVLDAEGRPKSGPEEEYVIAGPLCFAGDLLERRITLPSLVPGDYLLIHDTGAYTLSMWSRYNSRQIPAVLGYEDDGAAFEVLRPRESPERVVRFWS